MSQIGFNEYEEATWSNGTFSAGGSVSGKCTGYKYKENWADKPLYAAGNKPRAIQPGNIAYTGGFKLLLGDFTALTVAAKAAGAKSVCGMVISVVITYLPPGGTVMQDTWVSFKISSYEKGWDQGATEMVMDCQGNFTDLVTVP